MSLARTKRAPRIAALAFAAVVFAGSGAPAHLAVRLLILSPAEGARAGSDVVVRVQLQATLGGAGSTTFVMRLDGTPIDPGTGERQRQATRKMIRIGETVEVPLRALAPGRHEIIAEYRPDADEPPRTERVAFIVDEPGASTLLFAIASLVVIFVAILIARMALGMRRRRAAQQADVGSRRRR